MYRRTALSLSAVRRVSLFIGFASIVASSGTSYAYPDGFAGKPLAQACGNCHYKTRGPKIDLIFSKERPNKGETIDITVKLEAQAAVAINTGVYIEGSAGKFGLVNANITRLHSPTEVLHSKPMPLVDRKAEFKFKWTAPTAAGAATFKVNSVTSVPEIPTEWPGEFNSSSSSAGVAVDCEGKYYYPDDDGDGHGSADPNLREMSCEPVEGLIDVGGDCDDNDDKSYPGATEICDNKDNDCDGEPDEGLEPGLYFRDDDRDGFARGTSGGASIFTCNDNEGYAKERGDCDDNNKDVRPGAKEICNDIDDDCNGEVDDDCEDEASGGASGGSGSGGSGSGGSASGGSSGGSDGDDDGDTDEDNRSNTMLGGCSFGGQDASPFSIGLFLILGGVLLGRLTRRWRA